MLQLDTKVHLEDGVNREKRINQELCNFNFPLDTGGLEYIY